MIEVNELVLSELEQTDLDGDDQKCLTLAVVNVISLLAANWNAIKNVSEDEDAEGKVKVSLALDLNFGGKTPCGAVNISFSQKFKDGSTFKVEDKDQKKLFKE